MSESPKHETHWGLYAHKWDDRLEFVDWFDCYAKACAVCTRMYKSDEKDGDEYRTIKTFVIEPPAYGEVLA